MIRRWSSVIKLNIDIMDYLPLKPKRRLMIFKSAVKFKRYWNYGTKFKRRGLRKLHHRASWLIFLYVIKFWIMDTQFTKHWAKFQYHNRMFANSYMIFDSNYVKQQKLKLDMRQDQWVTAALTRKFYLSLHSASNFNFLSSYKSSGHILAFFPNDDLVPNWVTLPVLAIYDMHAFGMLSDIDHLEDENSPTTLAFNLAMNQKIEIYKILIILFYAAIVINK